MIKNKKEQKRARKFSVSFRWLGLLSLNVMLLFLMSTAVSAAVLNVPSSQYPTVQSAVDAASPGDTIVLQANTVFTESVVLRYKPGSDYITIQSSALASLPPDGVRVSPSNAQYMPKITSANSAPEIQTELTSQGPAHHYKLIGIELGEFNANGFSYGVVNLGINDTTQNTEAKVAHHFVVDRCYIHAHPDANVRNGINVNSADTVIKDSYISDIHDSNSDSIGIVGVNGIGRYSIINNYIESSSINVIFGGDDPKIANLVPADILFQKNYIKKNPAWLQRNPQWIVKNVFELKNAKRVTVEDNIIDTNWSGAIGRGDQNGTAVIFTPRNQGGNAPWSTVEDVTFRRNIVRNVTNGVSWLGRDYTNPSQPLKNLNISDNLIIPNGAGGLGDCFATTGTDSQNASLNHNTCIMTGGTGQSFFRMEDTSSMTGLDIKNNIGVSPSNQYIADIIYSGTVGTSALNSFAGNTWTLLNNVLVFSAGYNWRLTQYPTTNNTYLQDVQSIGFANVANGNYALGQSSPYRNAGTDGQDIGANVTLLNQQKPCIESGNWSTCATTATQTPYPGPNAPNAPTTIEAENFDKGGQGVAYNDTSGTTGSSVYRSNPVEGVDVQARTTASNGYAVFEAAAGEWLEYTVNFPTAGVYDLGVSYASEFNNGKFHVEIDGVNVTGQLTANSTGNWGTFQTVTKPGVNVSAGSHVVKLSLDVNSPDSCGCVVGNFDKLSFTAAASAGQGIVFNGSQYGQVTLPNTADFNNLNGFQMIWRVRDAAHPTPTGLPGFVFSLPDIGVLAYNPDQYTAVFDTILPTRSGDTHNGGVRITPTTFADSICKLQFDPANSRWTLETWNANGTGYVSQTMAIQNTANLDLRNQTLGIAASYYQNRPFKGKLDYWRWIKRVEPLGVFPTQAAPTGVNYLLDYEFEGNGNDSSGKNAHLTLTGSPTYMTTP